MSAGPVHLHNARAHVHLLSREGDRGEPSPLVRLQVNTCVFQSLRVLLAWGELPIGHCFGPAAAYENVDSKDRHPLETSPVLLTSVGREVELRLAAGSGRPEVPVPAALSVAVTLAFCSDEGEEFLWHHHVDDFQLAAESTPGRLSMPFRQGLTTL
ncbi:MAG: hypothetical protein QOE32_3495 [Pseudonocardiales bacterium]|jgi:hypothetical protein|nr:hypothetical protein [Pseudonocardiales bacterium]